MKYLVNFSLPLFLFTIVAVKTLPAQQLPGKTFPELPVRPEVPPKVSQQTAWDIFKAKQPAWKIRWGTRSQAPASLLGPPVQVTSGTPEQIARTFLDSHLQLLAMRPNLEDLQVYSVEQRYRADHVTFQQMYAGLPVEWAVYAVNMTKDGRVYYASGDYFDEVAVASTTPAISLKSAVDLAKQDFRTDLEMEREPEGMLVILPYGAGFRLAWKILIPARQPLGRWVYYLSAQDGSVLTGFNDMDVATADGDVYDHHPEAGPVVTRTLTHLDGSGTQLNGSYVSVINEDAAEAYETDGTFLYSPENTHFDEVMVYHHATEFQKFMGAEVSYPYLNYPDAIIQVQATVHVGTNFNNAGATAPDILEFGDGDGTNYNDFAKEDNVIAHEYQHLITEDITYNGLDGGPINYNQTEAMDEGFSDYFGGTYAGSGDIGVYVVVGPGQLRDMDNTYTMSDWDGVGDDAFLANDFHEGSQIFTGALWDLRQQLGSGTANVLMFEGLDNLNQANPEFIDGRDAIMAADNAEYSGSHNDLIQNTFAGRGIGEYVVDPLSVYISGPSTFPQYQGYAEWTANPSGGLPPYSYQWEQRTTYRVNGQCFPDDQWQLGTTNQTTGRTWSDDICSIYLRVTVTDAQPASTSATHTVYYESSSSPYSISQSGPNPFNPSTNISYVLPEQAEVRLEVYNLIGQKVAILVDGSRQAGKYTARFDASGLASGMYLARFTAEGVSGEMFSKILKMQLIK